MYWVLIPYLLFSLSGWLAIVVWWTSPERWTDFRGRYIWEDGLDLSWCELIAMGILSLLPLVDCAFNFFWLLVLRQKIKRYPLIKLPKCPIAIKGKAK